MVQIAREENETTEKRRKAHKEAKKVAEEMRGKDLLEWPKTKLEECVKILGQAQMFSNCGFGADGMRVKRGVQPPSYADDIYNLDRAIRGKGR